MAGRPVLESMYLEKADIRCLRLHGVLIRGQGGHESQGLQVRRKEDEQDLAVERCK